MAAGGTWFVDPVLLVDSIHQGVDKVHGKLTATAYCSCYTDSLAKEMQNSLYPPFVKVFEIQLQRFLPIPIRNRYMAMPRPK